MANSELIVNYPGIFMVDISHCIRDCIWLEIIPVKKKKNGDFMGFSWWINGLEVNIIVNISHCI